MLAVPTCCWASSLHTVLSSATANAEQAIDCALDLDGSCQKKGTSGGKVPATTDDDTSAPPIPLQCGVYMAPSTLGEATNMGMYAGKEYGPNTVIQSEIAIPLLFREWGAHRRGFTDGAFVVGFVSPKSGPRRLEGGKHPCLPSHRDDSVAGLSNSVFVRCICLVVVVVFVRRTLGSVHLGGECGQSRSIHRHQP